MKKLICFICLLALGTIPTGCVTQKDLYPFDERLYRLERQLRTLEQSTQKTIGDKESQLRDQSATLAAQVDRLRETNQQLTGRIEELEYQIASKAKANSELEQSVGQRVETLSQKNQTLTARIAQLEQYLNLEPSTPSGVGGITSGTGTTSPPPSEQGLFDLAKKAFDRDDAETARVNFEQFIQQYPQSKDADDAQFCLAEIFFREEWFEKAILEYQKVIEAYPDGNRVSAALLKQAISFDKLKDPTNARLIFQELVKRYPNSNEAKIAQKKLDEM